MTPKRDKAIPNPRRLNILGILFLSTENMHHIYMGKRTLEDKTVSEILFGLLESKRLFLLCRVRYDTQIKEKHFVMLVLVAYEQVPVLATVVLS